MQEKFSLSEQFSARLTEAIGQFPLKQKELASKVNLTEQTLSRYKSGTRLPDTEELYRLANFLGVSIDWLLGKDESTGESAWRDRAIRAEQKLAAFKRVTAKLGDITQELSRIASEE